MPILEFHVNEITQYTHIFCVCLLYLKIRFLRFIHAGSVNSWLYPFVWIYHTLHIYFPVTKHLSCFKFVALMNTVTMHSHMHVVLRICFYFSWVNIYEWNSCGKWQAIPFCTPLVISESSIVPHRHQHLVLPFSLNCAILVG